MLRRFVASAALTAGIMAMAFMLPQADASEAEFQKLIKAAQAEGEVSVFLGGSMPRTLRVVMPEFEKKYGIKMHFETGSSRRHSARILAERKAGKYTVDAWIGGANSALSILYPNGVLDPVDELLVDPEVVDPSKWYKGKHHYTDPKGRYIFTWGASPAHVVSYNTNLVKPEEIKSYWDLLNPKWKGKIVGRSPGRRGSGASSVPLLLHPKVGEEWYRRYLNEMNPTIVKDKRQGAEWLAVGRYAIGLFGINSPAHKMAKEGFPVRSYLPHPMKEGEILSASAANIYAVNKPPHPNARALFINWALSKEVQEMFIKTGERTDSLRTDVDNSVIEEQYRILEDRDYHVAFSDPEYINNQKKLLKKLKRMVKEAKIDTK